jgi:hypothetical protein
MKKLLGVAMGNMQKGCQFCKKLSKNFIYIYFSTLNGGPLRFGDKAGSSVA